MPATVIRTLGVRGIQRLGRLPIAASQTWNAGDYLALNSTGQLIVALAVGNDYPAYSSGLTNLIVGRATEDAQPATNDVTIVPTVKLYGEFIIAEPGTQFELPVYHATATSAYPVLNQLTVAYNFSFRTITNNPVWCINIASSSAPVVQIQDFVPDYLLSNGYPDCGQTALPTTGTLAQYGSAWGEFLGGACAFTTARPITRTN